MGGATRMQINGYDEFVEVGRGGFAVVYRARQTRLRRLVAVKVLTGGDTSEDALGRFEAECAAIGALSGHANVVAVHDAGTTADGRPYLAMEYLPDGSLAQRIERGPAPPAEVLAIGAQLADALSAAHAADVLHRDVKPENVLLGPNGTPKLADFGIAVVADVHQTATGVVIGTVLHSAPEVLHGHRATVSTDVYSLASTLFTLIYGRPAFAGRHDEGVAPVMYRTVHDPVPDLRPQGVPGPVADLLEQGMAKDPAARFGSSAAFLRAIEGTIDSISSPAPAPPTPAPRPPLTPVILPAPHRAGSTRARQTPVPPMPPQLTPQPGPAGFAPPAPTPQSPPGPSPGAYPTPVGAAPPFAAAPAPPPSAADAAVASPPERPQRGLVAALVVAVFVLVVAIIAALVVLLGGDDPASVNSVDRPSSSSRPSTSASASTSASTTSTSTTTTTQPPPVTTAPPRTAPPRTTAPPPPTTTEPRAATPEQGAAAVRARYPDYVVTDPSGFRTVGAGVILGEDTTGRMQAFLFGDGRLKGRDSTQPSIHLNVVAVGGNQVVLQYDLWPPGGQPPDPPLGSSTITLTWDGGDTFDPDPPDFPSTDINVDGHR